jgi:hypothetical protein
MRRTVNFADDAVELARRAARRNGVSLGEAVSELVRRGARRAMPTMERNGFTVIRLPAGSPRVTVATVDALREAREARSNRSR